MRRHEPLRPDRRRLLIGLSAAGLIPSGAAMAQTAAAPSEHYLAARRAISAGREIVPGRVTLDVPRLAESGNSVALKVSVASPMTADDHVRVIHVLSEQNPIAVVARFHLGPRSGRAEISTNIRLATTQNVHAVAETSDGRLWTASTEVVVLLAACLDAT